MSEWCDTHAKKSKNKGYCIRCYAHLFPNEKSSTRYRTKEKAVAEYIQNRFENMNWIFDKTACGCSKRRPDILVDMFTHVIIIEVDENKHEGYTCESKRMCEISQDFAHRPIVFIRFNPDAYEDDNGIKVTSCWNDGVVKKNKKNEWNLRLKTLENKVSEHISCIPYKTITIEHLFY
jgi:hypothetical protein